MVSTAPVHVGVRFGVRAPARAAAFALVLALCAGVLGGCIPSANGECSRDADCTAGAAGSFCADGICQGPTLATLTVPAGPFARNATIDLHVELQRIHGGPASASAQLDANGTTLSATHAADGSLLLHTPLSFAPANAEGNVPLQVRVSDDLGHQTLLAGSVLVDDEGPRITVDARSIPAAATVRGAIIPLRVTLADEASATLQFSIDGAPAQPASVQADGSFLADLDTSQAAPAATSFDVHLTAHDSLGNVSQQTVSQLQLTRLRWRAHSATGRPLIGFATTPTAVIATTEDGNFVIVDRAAGTRTEVPISQGLPSGNLVADDTAAYTALTDGRVCKLGLDGSVQWCCESIGTISASIALGAFPNSQSGAAPVSTVVAVTSGTAGRFFALRQDADGFCRAAPSQTVATFSNDSPAIAPDGTVFATAAKALALGVFDGLAWTSQATALSGDGLGQPAFAPALAGELGQRILFSNTGGDVEALLYPAPGAAGTLPGTPAPKFSVPASPDQLAASTPAIGEDGTAYVSTFDSQLVAIAPDGSVRWSTLLASAPSAAPVAGAGGIIYSTGTDGTLSAYGLDGGVQWSFATGSNLVAPAAPGCDRSIYLGTSAGEILSIAADAPGLADSLWPREGHDLRGTGDSRRQFRAADGGCAE